MRRIISVFSVLLTLSVVASLAALFILGPEYQRYYSQTIQTEENSYVVPNGSHLGRIANDFAAKGWIESPTFLRYWYRWQGDAHRIKAGEYAIEAGDTVAALLDKMVRGEVMARKLTIVEGARFADFRAALAKAGGLNHKTKQWSDAEILKALGSDFSHPEGLFFPDTYFYTRDESDLDVLKRAYQAMQQTLAQQWDKRVKGLPIKTPYEALILASIIEKETGQAGERAEIAGVFVRRLQKGMRLQTDPTIIYGMGDRYDGNIRRKDILEATAYNTYVIDGLPPTPIALPGLAAIHATLNPADGNALYFVAKGDGSHYFSATLAEHNRAVARYQLKK